jgi:transposase
MFLILEEDSMPETPARFVALDVHKAYVVIGAVDATQTVVLPPRRIALAQFSDWAGHHLLPTDQVVLETTINAWAFYDQLVPLVSRVVVANPAHIKLIAASLVKTDKRDTLVLARLLAANLIPAVWVPPPEVRELRALVTHRQRLLKQRTLAKNRLQSLLHQHTLTPPGADPFAPSHQAWWETLEQHLPSSERLRSHQDRAVVTYLTTLIDTVEAELARVSQEEPWKGQVPFLIQLPGISLIGAMTVLAAIGDISRFPSAKHLVGYAGLGARIHASGQVHRSGSITRTGRAELRTLLVEAAWTSVRTSPWWRARYEHLTARMPPAKAIVAIARKLLVVIWHVLTERAADRQADPVAVARRLFRWGATHHLATRSGLSRGGFVRQALDQIGVGQDLTRLAINGSTYLLKASG